MQTLNWDQLKAAGGLCFLLTEAGSSLMSPEQKLDQLVSAHI